MKRSCAVFVLLPVLLVLSCGGFYMVEQDNPVEPKVDPDKSTLVVMRTTSFGFAVVFPSYIDGKYIGQTKGKSYFITKVDPGEHWLIGEGENRAVAKITFESGKVYYLEQLVIMGAMKARTGWHPRDPEYFREQLPELSYLVAAPDEKGEDMEPEDLQEDKENFEEEIREDPEQHKNTLEYVGYE